MKAKRKVKPEIIPGIMQTMRDIRDKQSEKYYHSPELMEEDLKKVRRKYKIKSPTSNNHTCISLSINQLFG